LHFNVQQRVSIPHLTPLLESGEPPESNPDPALVVKHDGQPFSLALSPFAMQQEFFF